MGTSIPTVVLFGIGETIRTLGTTIDADRVQYSAAMMSLSIEELYDLGYEMYIEPTTLTP